MKLLIDLLCTLVAIIMLYSVADAAKDTAEAAATIEDAVNIEKDNNNKISNTAGDLLFGTIVPDATGGTVLINPSDYKRYSSLVAVGQDHGPAAFHVKAAKNKHHSINLQSGSVTVKYKNNTMIVDNLTSNIASGTTDDNGDSNFTIGGTLHVNPNQESGSYTGTFSVSTDYE